jgi:hypothetical protein
MISTTDSEKFKHTASMYLGEKIRAKHTVKNNIGSIPIFKIKIHSYSCAIKYCKQVEVNLNTTCR